MTGHSIILKYLQSQQVATISTISIDGRKPESALVAFAELETLEIIFETFYDTRKFHNLEVNNQVAFVVGWDTDAYITLQYEGRAHLLTDEDVETHRRIFLQKDTPCTEKFLHDPRVRLYKVAPTWIRYSDYTGAIPRIFELTF